MWATEYESLWCVTAKFRTLCEKNHAIIDLYNAERGEYLCRNTLDYFSLFQQEIWQLIIFVNGWTKKKFHEQQKNAKSSATIENVTAPRLVQKGGVYHGFYIILYHRCYGRCDLPSHLQMARQERLGQQQPDGYLTILKNKKKPSVVVQVQPGASFFAISV